jgi:hypothetical protein
VLQLGVVSLCQMTGAVAAKELKDQHYGGERPPSRHIGKRHGGGGPATDPVG